MILLDTHIWYWYLGTSPRLSSDARKLIDAARDESGIRVSVISCWEILQKAAAGKLTLNLAPEQWLGYALADPHLSLVNLTPQIIADSVALPQPFHKDPADRFIVASARVLSCPLLTQDDKILNYPHVELAT